MGMTFEICNEGELYMICQGSGGGYGDVLERDPALVMKDLAEELLSHDIARDIYQVVYDERTLVVDEAATRLKRSEYRALRIRRMTRAARESRLMGRMGPGRSTLSRTTSWLTAST